MSEEKLPNVPTLPQIYKEQEYALMLEFIVKCGYWSDTNLATACHVERHTIADWKKRPEAIEAHRKAIMKFSQRRTDTEKILKELDMEISPDQPGLTQNNLLINLSDEQLTTFITSKVGQVGVSQLPDRVGAAKTGESTEVPKGTC